MVSHTIQVTFVQPRVVKADPNPLPARGGSPPNVAPGDKVTWIIPDGRTLEAVFSKVVDLDRDGKPTGDSRPTDSNGPFTSLSPARGTIEGTVRSDVSQDIARATRYFYKLTDDEGDLQWDPRVEGGDMINGGGIDTPRTPP